MADWAETLSDDLRLDLFVSPELEWEVSGSGTGVGKNPKRSPIKGNRPDQLQSALAKHFQTNSLRHLLLVDEAGAGKTILTLKIQHLLSEEQTSQRIFADSQRRIVVHWPGKLPKPQMRNQNLLAYLFAGLEEELLNAPSLEECEIGKLRSQMKPALKSAFFEGRIVVILDGLDELSSRQKKVVGQLFQQSSQVVHWIVASRENAVKEALSNNSHLDFQQFKRLRIKPFSEALQNQYMEKAKMPGDWRKWLGGGEDGWDELLELPYHLREIVRFRDEINGVDPSWQSPSVLFSQFARVTIKRELNKEDNKNKWQKVVTNSIDQKLVIDRRVDLVERLLGAAALEMATRELWREVSADDVTSEVDKIWTNVETRFRESIKGDKVRIKGFDQIWEWVRDFCEDFQLNKGCTQGDLAKGWLSFRSKRVLEMWAARYLVKYASEADLRGYVGKGVPKSVWDCLGNEGWSNLWRCCYRMPLFQGFKPHGAAKVKYLKALKLLFERPRNPGFRRPTELMWEAEQWLLGKGGDPLVSIVREHLADQFEPIKQRGSDEQRMAIQTLLNPDNYVYLQCCENPKLKGDTGKFKMGVEEVSVELSPFAICTFTLTRQQARLFDNGFEGEDRLPATDWSWFDSYWWICFLAKQTVFKGGSKFSFRMPTEAEWEYACRAGCDTFYCFGNETKKLRKYAWYRDNVKAPKRNGAQRVCELESNAWGLFDMHGNVHEWVSDGWVGNLRGGKNPRVRAPLKDSRHVFRGGGWYDRALSCMSLRRDFGDPGYRQHFLGFRVALTSSGITE